jgi:alkylmercury lyase
MPTDTDQLAARVATALDRPGTARALPGGWYRSLLRLLAEGRPVTAERLAAAVGQPAATVADAVRSLPDIETDERGDVVGYGITLRPTPHRFTVDGRQLYTWCALDTLMFPAVIGKTARIQSPCHATGAPIHLTVTGEQIGELSPATAVVSIVAPDDARSIRGAFCDAVHFFATPAAARPWLGQHPDGLVLPVAEALQLGLRINQPLRADDQPSCC